MTTAREPAKNPCGSCPYRQDVPSGVWAPEEYAKLIGYDRPTGEQPMGVFYCHQQDGRICAGWAGCHDMDNNLGLRIAAAFGHISQEVLVATLTYTTKVRLFATGLLAAEHGLAAVDEPDERAKKVVSKIERKRVKH